METHFISWFLLLFVVAAASFFKLLHRPAGRGGNGRRFPPGPRPLPIIGNLHKFLGAKPHISLAKLAEVHGPVITLRLGSATAVVVSSPDAAREVLQRNDAALSVERAVPASIRASGHAAASIVWSPAGPEWRTLRRICATELFTNNRLNADKALRHRKVQELMSYLFKRSGAAVDMGTALSATMLNLLSNTIFSDDFVDLNSEGASEELKVLVHSIMDEAGSPNLADYFTSLRPLDPQGRARRVTALFKKLHAVFDGYIDSRLPLSPEKSAAPPSDMLDTLLRFPDLDKETIKSLLNDLFAAGSDTSSSTIEWAMAELLRWPEAMEKARAELRRELGPPVPETEVAEDDIGRLPYLQAVVKETLRLHPSVPFLLPRRVPEAATVELCGYTVPEGAQLLVNVWAIGRDAAVWPHPEKFRPERFLDESGGGGRGGPDYRGGDFTLIPFGGGRRICPGLPLALRMVHLMLASLIHRFEWRLADGKSPAEIDMGEKFGLTLAMASPLRAIPVPAKP